MLEFTLSEPGNELRLLPATYSFSYEDPTGLLKLSGHETDAFAAMAPQREAVSFFPSILPDVVPAITAEVDRLWKACKDEGFIGASCPPELVEAMQFSSSAEPIEGEWFRKSGPGIFLTGQEHEATTTYLFHSEQLPQDVTVTYSGTVARNAAGEVTFSR